jgi:hypothetical protein
VTDPTPDLVSRFIEQNWKSTVPALAFHFFFWLRAGLTFIWYRAGMGSGAVMIVK